MRSTPAVPLRTFHLWFEGNLCVHCSRFPVLRYELSIGRVFFFFYKHSLWNLILQKVESKFLKREIFFSSLFFIISFKKIEKFWFVKLFKFRFIYNNLITMMVILLKFCFVVKYRKGVDIFRSKIFWVAFILQNMDAALRDCRLSFSMQFPLMRNNFRKQFSRVLLLNVPWNMPKG